MAHIRRSPCSEGEIDPNATPICRSIYFVAVVAFEVRRCRALHSERS